MRQRADWGRWAAEAVPAQSDDPDESDDWLAHENAVARLALAWAAASDYATDVLFAPRALEGTDALIAFHGVQADALTDSLIDFFTPAKAIALPLPAPQANRHICLHAAPDAEDEAQRAAACVLNHVAAGRTPVALASSDRALMRRVRALLGERLSARDETGWKLSTTQSAAILMAALTACARHADSDDVLAWLKLAPAARAWPARAVPALEKHLRRHAMRQWPAHLPAHLPAHSSGDADDLAQALQAINAARAICQAPRPLSDWLKVLRDLLQAAGQWEPLARDAAGARVLEALLLTDEAARDLRDLPTARQRFTLPEFTAWAADALEAEEQMNFLNN